MLWKAQAIITIISFHLAIHWNSSFAVACYYWLIPHLLVHNNFILQFLNSLLLFHKVIISFNFHAIHSSINIWQSTNGVCFVRVASSSKSDSWQQLANKHTNYAYLTFWASIQSIYFCIASSFDMPTNSPNQTTILPFKAFQAFHFALSYPSLQENPTYSQREDSRGRNVAISNSGLLG